VAILKQINLILEQKMPKLKSNRGAAKRFRKQGESYKYRCSDRNHILTKKSTKRKRHLRKGGVVGTTDIGRIKQMLPC
jgi:large subunit ribosomal protein L35